MSVSEELARTETKCRGCNKEKEIGLVVCWSCFKHPVHPFKTYNGTLSQWIEEIMEEEPSLIKAIKNHDAKQINDLETKANNGEIIRLI